MGHTTNLLSAADEEAVIAAIGQAEKNTSGEIRVHIEKSSKKPPLERAQEVFAILGMNATAARNGVLFYIGIKDRTFAIIGDEGIDKVVEADFWQSTKDLVTGHFKQGRFAQGLINGILLAGDRLKTHFPYNADDINELPDTISKG